MCSSKDANKDARRVLVWVDEKSHKKESQPILTSLEGLANQFGFELKCFKKAPTYEAWLRRAVPVEHILVVAHRELKPCLAMFTQDSDVHFPTLSIVLLNEERLESRVSRLVRCIRRSPLPGGMDLQWVNSTEKLLPLLAEQQQKLSSGGQKSLNTSEGSSGILELNDSKTPSISDEDFQLAWSTNSSNSSPEHKQQKVQQLQLQQQQTQVDCLGSTLGAEGRLQQKLIARARLTGEVRRPWNDINDDEDDDLDVDVEHELEVGAPIGHANATWASSSEEGYFAHPQKGAGNRLYDTTSESDSFAPLCLDHLPGPVSQFMQNLFPHHTHMQIHAALLAAQPESYEL